MDPMKAWWRRIRPYVISDIVYAIVRGIGRTLRLKTAGAEVLDQVQGAILCGWHGRSLLPANYLKGKKFWAIISHSRDGEIQTRIFTKFGFQVIRGSTGRGGERALIESIRVLRSGEKMAITPDGPRGPFGVVQPGVVLMAKKSGAVLIPVGSAAKPCWLVPTWDHYMIPWFFAKASFTFGEPIEVEKDADEAAMEAARSKLQVAIEFEQIRAEGLL